MKVLPVYHELRVLVHPQGESIVGSLICGSDQVGPVMFGYLYRCRILPRGSLPKSPP